MSEFTPGATLEAEIVALSQKLAEKKRQLEASAGGQILDERELLAEIVAEEAVAEKELSVPTVTPVTTINAPTKPNVSVNKKAVDYLDTLDQKTTETVNGYIAIVGTKGLRAALLMVQGEVDPIVIDVFHDVLVTKLYEELKTRNLI